MCVPSSVLRSGSNSSYYYCWDNYNYPNTVVINILNAWTFLSKYHSSLTRTRALVTKVDGRAEAEKHKMNWKYLILLDIKKCLKTGTFLFFEGGARDRTQGPALARQTLYHLS